MAFKGGGLAYPVSAHQTYQLPFPDLQGGVVQDMAFAEKAIHILQDQHISFLNRYF